MTSDRAQSDNTGRWESEGGAEPEGPATNVPADLETEDHAPDLPGQAESTDSSVPSEEPDPQDLGESG